MEKIKIIREGITHIEDLPVHEFIDAIRNMGKMIATEKLDGAQLWFGLDDQGRLYTSRAGKRRSAENVYNEADYPKISASNGFRSTHTALKAKEEEIKKVMRNGDTVEIEVLYGRQPNAVTYGADGKNYIAFLRGVNGTPDAIVDQLTATMDNTQVRVNVDIVDTTDGENLSEQNTELVFQFVGVQKINTSLLKDVNLEKQLKKLETYLGQTVDDTDLKDFTNALLISTSLGSIDKSIRPVAKIAKTEIIARIMTDFKLPIKRELLNNFLKKIKPALAAADLNSDEDIGIEGVVFRDPVTGEQIKLVDKDGFTTINQFNFAVRSQISGTIKSVDADAPLESRGGIVGDLKIKIADLLGNKDLARGLSAKKIFLAVKGNSPEETLRNVAKNLKGDNDFLATQRKILALISATNQEMGKTLQQFKDNQNDFQLELKSGKTIGLSTEVIKRTLLTFAEAKKSLVEMFEKVKKAKSVVQLTAIFWGRYAKEAHLVDDVTESLLENKYQTDKKLYTGKDAWTLLNIYFATIFIAALIYKIDDKQGIRLLNDKAHYRLNFWATNMSPVNFWGYPIWRSTTGPVRRLLGKKNAGDIAKVIKNIPYGKYRDLHDDFSTSSSNKIDWNKHYKTMKLLQLFPGLRIDRINKLLVGIFKFEELTLDQKVKTLNMLYYYSMQYVPSSPLITRLRAAQSSILINANGEDNIMIEGSLLKRIIEDGETADSSAPAPSIDSNTGFQSSNSATEVATTASSIASKAFVLGKGKMIVRIKRNPNAIKKKFQKPEGKK